MGLKEKLENSARERAIMEKQFGMIPVSVLRLTRGELSKKMFIYQHQQQARASAVTCVDSDAYDENTGGNADQIAKLAERNHRLQAEAAKLGKKIAVASHVGNNRVVASTMPAELVEFFVKYYSKPGDVYLDPFMGQGIRMQVAKYLGLDYYGYDLSEEFYKYVKQVQTKIDDGSTVMSVNWGDSRHPDKVPDGIGDFSFHSPPYWDIEYYGDEPEQLGNGSYEEFLLGLEDVARAWYPKFKSGAWHVVNVNDFRRGNKFYSYHSDTCLLYTSPSPRDGLLSRMPSSA